AGGAGADAPLLPGPMAHGGVRRSACAERRRQWSSCNLPWTLRVGPTSVERQEGNETGVGMSTKRLGLISIGCLSALASAFAAAQTSAPDGRLAAVAAAPVTDDVLAPPGPADWLMYRRTYDAQRFSPLDQINRDNVANLERVWTKPLPPGTIEIIPLVYKGVMYLVTPGGREGPSEVLALDAATGDELWRYTPEGQAA